MKMDAVLTAYQTNVEQVADMVFRTMLGLEIQPYPMDWVPADDLVTAAVYFAGAWNGAILLECTRRQAMVFTQLLMSIEMPASIDADVRDALGELTNMLAGNMKSVLPAGAVLSIPSVIEGGAYSLTICGKNAIERAPFWCTEDVFAVTFVETAPR